MSEHNTKDHVVSGSPADQATQIIARHLCGWITGHAGPVDNFIADAELIINDLHKHGIRFHALGLTANPNDGYVDLVTS